MQTHVTDVGCVVPSQYWIDNGVIAAGVAEEDCSPTLKSSGHGQASRTSPTWRTWTMSRS